MPTDFYNPQQAKQAYDSLVEKINAVADQAFARLNLDPYEAGGRGLTAAAELAKPEVGAVFESVAQHWEARYQRELLPLSWALLYAVVEAQKAGEVADHVRLPVAIGDGAMGLRKVMLKVLDHNIGDDPDNAALITRIRAGAGYYDLSKDLQVLASLYEKHANVISGDRFYSAAHVNEANALVAALLEHLGSNKAEKSWKLQVRRAWSLFYPAYEEVRRVANFVFHKDPAHLAAFPSLYANR